MTSDPKILDDPDALYNRAAKALGPGWRRCPDHWSCWESPEGLRRPADTILAGAIVALADRAERAERERDRLDGASSALGSAIAERDDWQAKAGHLDGLHTELASRCTDLAAQLSAAERERDEARVRVRLLLDGLTGELLDGERCRYRGRYCDIHAGRTDPNDRARLALWPEIVKALRVVASCDHADFCSCWPKARSRARAVLAKADAIDKEKP